ncbi:hypothetical protein JCM10908_002164 [Rhodotorula pacifica]|uniref:uncharacterized protein n=1 Tax=Rhodotorula pacifica TaxID=1495444 RepID=UPI00316B8CFA
MVIKLSKSTAAVAALLAACALPAASAYQYTVGVGKDQSTGQPGLGFDPSRTTIADVNTGNTVVFTFLEGIHRVVQTDGSLNAPCSPSGGFDTGLQTVAKGTNGPSFTFDISNNSATYYFADIATDWSPCYLGAIFCVNTDETSSTTSCHAVQAAAVSLGKQQGVTTTPGLSSSSTSATAASSASSSASASTSSSSSSSSRSASASGSGATAQPSSAERATSGAAPSFVSGAATTIGGIVVVAAGAMALFGAAA